jgi:hypothetical protein
MGRSRGLHYGPHTGWYRSSKGDPWRRASDGPDWQSAWLALVDATRHDRDADLLVLAAGQEPASVPGCETG